MPKSYIKKYQGHEAEILTDVRLYTSMGAMLRWGAHDYVSWDRYIKRIQSKSKDKPLLEVEEITIPQNKKYIDQDKTQSMNMPAVIKIPGADKNEELPVVINPSRSIAIELVEAFTDKVLQLSAENASLKAKIEALEFKVKVYEDKSNHVVGNKVLEALEVIRHE